MPSIDQILRQEVNPFDTVNFRPGNFWQESPDRNLTVSSIHQDAIDEMGELLDLVVADSRTRTVLLCGDSGAGKSHLLGRLKQVFNDRAFFAYIGPWPDRSFLWRHILRNTVDSLLKVPEGRQESQLLIWLKSLSVFKERTLLDYLLGDRQRFIRKLREIYPTDLYNANEFLGVLFQLLDPDLFWLASDWLRGENLDDEDLKLLRVRQPIDTEDAALRLLSNFGRISADTQPIVLCFDNLDCITSTPEGYINFQALLNVNSTIHNEKLSNFLIAIGVIINTANTYLDRLQPSDLARIDRKITLKSISIDRAIDLYAARLHPLHQQAEPPPTSPIFPIVRSVVEQNFPGGKTKPRNALELARRLILEYKMGRAIEVEDLDAAFQLTWHKERAKIQERVTRIRHFSSLEWIQSLQLVLQALEIEISPSPCLARTKYAPYSLCYQTAKMRTGVVWIEDPNLTSFFYVMQACQQAIADGSMQAFYLIRAETVGTDRNKGYQLYQQLFQSSDRNSDRLNRHIIPTLDAAIDLAAYQSLVYAATSRELAIGGEIIEPGELAKLLGHSPILQSCSLLQELEIIDTPKTTEDPDLVVRRFLLSAIATQQLIGRKILIDRAIEQFPKMTETQIDRAIEQLNCDRCIQILDLTASREAQLIARL
jgi:hypothetical protein